MRRAGISSVGCASAGISALLGVAVPPLTPGGAAESVSRPAPPGVPTAAAAA